MTGKIFSLILLFVFSVSGAQAQTLKEYYCDQGKQLEKQAHHDELFNKYMAEGMQGFAEIAKDAKTRFYWSTAIGVVSTALLTWEMSSAVVTAKAGTSGGLITQLISKLQSLNLGTSAAGAGAGAAGVVPAGVAAGAANASMAAGGVVVLANAGQTIAFSISKVLANVLLTSVAFDGVPVFVGPALYVAGRIVYVLNTSKGSINYVLPDVEEAEDQLKDQIAKIEMERTQLIENPPGMVSNSLSFGEANYDHYTKIVNLGSVESQLRSELVMVERNHARVLQSNCQQ